MPSVFLFATPDTKGREADFVRDLLRSWRVAVTLVDVPGARGLNGVCLDISNAHEGLKQAISTVLTGSTWQRCRVHFMRNLLATVPRGAGEAIAAIVRTIFAQPDHASAMMQLRKVADGLRTRFARAPPCWKTPRRTSWRIGICPSSTNGSCTARILSSDCTRK